MSIGRKFTWRFINYFLLLYVLINVAVIALFIYLTIRWDGTLLTGDLTTESTSTMQSLINTKGGISIKQPLRDALKKNDSMLLIRDENGRTLKVFNQNNEQLHGLYWYYIQDITTWSLTPDRQAVLISRKPIVKAAELFDLRQDDKLKRYMNQHELGLFMQSSRAAELKKIHGDFSTKLIEKAWFQDLNGDNFNDYNIRETLRDGRYYLFVQKNPSVLDKQIIFDENGVFKDQAFMSDIKNFLLWYLGFSVLVFGIILTLALILGYRLTRPLVHFIDWVKQLQSGTYVVPENDKVYRRGRLRRKYRMYTSVDESIKELTTKLRMDEAYQKRIGKLREEWIAGISHDLKTPLSSIYGYSKLLTSDIEITGEERQRFAEIIEDKALYIDTLIKDLNMTYELKSDVLEFNKEATPIVPYINQFVDNYNQPNLRYVNQTDAVVLIDRERMKRVLLNIISNAFVHNDNVDVWLNTTAVDDALVITIADNGSGINKEELPYIFNHYYRGTNTTADTNGSGLGLAVAQQIVRSHNGRIEVESSVAGTQFRIYLPLNET
ncbi:HAMP domain-containing histidine kinase [Macrococcus equipercicus]|uniref:histidine kinase n=1 Tax=Macrococcus equipercicus TaxID=69967 RepID=A0ABQ6R839_9STAP|nr:HAMP domain-containing sensor histidine kinase [Macrococcus equipercicus]KAA1039281.1 HAMP domain-containing histidine kinase [Macrococcus equipercicus]